jgi:hypothetical protein
MTLEQKKKVLELAKVEVARKELEFKIEERLEEIERLKAHIQTQIETENRLKSQIEASKA